MRPAKLPAGIASGEVIFGIVRLILGTSLALGALVSACAALSGLNNYSQGEGDASVTGPEAGGDDGPATDNDALLGDDAAAIDDPSGETGSAEDVRPIVDARPDHSADAGRPPACAPANCNGCCLNGTCYGGGSVSTCGTGGQQCKDCTSQGACNAGTCGAHVADAGPSPCMGTNVSGCKNQCSGTGIYATCCKGDNTCGCQFPFAPCN